MVFELRFRIRPVVPLTDRSKVRYQVWGLKPIMVLTGLFSYIFVFSPCTFCLYERGECGDSGTLCCVVNVFHCTSPVGGGKPVRSPVWDREPVPGLQRHIRPARRSESEPEKQATCKQKLPPKLCKNAPIVAAVEPRPPV